MLASLTSLALAVVSTHLFQWWVSAAAVSGTTYFQSAALRRIFFCHAKKNHVCSGLVFYFFGSPAFKPFINNGERFALFHSFPIKTGFPSSLRLDVFHLVLDQLLRLGGLGLLEVVDGEGCEDEGEEL